MMVSMASKVSRPTWPTSSGRAPYMVRSAVSASALQLAATFRLKVVRLLATSTGSLPMYDRGSWAWKATASDTALPGMALAARSSQPVGVVLLAGVPVSMKSWASKCERDRS